MQEQSIFIEALEKSDPDERAAFLDRVCAGDTALRQRMERLLQRHQQSGVFLERPASELGATVDEPSLGERPSTMIGPYKLLQQIGEGGMGVVWMAEQEQPVRRKVALKIIKPGMDSRQVIARFEAERQALALMDHHNIARVLDAGTTESSRPYFVMELIHGIPITKYCDDNQLTPRERLELFVPVCRAIQHAHQKGVIHRDVKPSNVLVTLYDGKPVPKVIDFGVAKAIEQHLTEKTLFTQYGTIIGTFEYMSPEQAETSALGVDTRSDIYSLGVLLYELLTGTTPLEKQRLRDASYAEIVRLICEEEPPKPSTRLNHSETLPAVAAARKTEPAKLAKLFRGELDWIVMKALEKDRNRRYDSASALAEDVQRYLRDETVQACPPSTGYRLRKFARRNKAVLVTMSMAALAVFLVVGVIAGSLGWMARDRSMRYARLNLEIKQALDEAEKACDQALTLTDNPYQWEAVLAAAASAIKRADGLAAQEEAGLEPAVHERLKALRVRLDADENDRRFVARFDDIRLEQTEIHEAVSDFKLEITFPAFKKAFQTHYAITFGQTPSEKVLSFLEQRPRPIRQYLVAALDFSLAYLPKGDPAARDWLAAVLRAVDSSDPWRKQTRAALQARDWQALSKLLEGPAATRRSPVVLLGLEAANPWDDTRALDLWRYIRQSYPGDFWANHGLACVLHYSLRQPRLEEAIRYYTAAIALRPHSPTPYLNLGNALRSKGELDEAIAVYRLAIAIAPRYSAAHDRLHLALVQKGCLDEAIAEIREMMQSRNDTRDQVVLGNLLARKGLVDGAIACFRKAITCYRQAIELNRDDDLSYNGLAWILVTCPEQQFRNPAEAVNLARKAVELLPRNGNYWNTLGVAHYRAGNWKEAVEALARSMQLRNGGDSGDWYFLAMAHWQLRSTGEARRWYDKAIEWMEKNEPTDDELCRFRAEAAELLKIEVKKK